MKSEFHGKFFSHKTPTTLTAKTVTPGMMLGGWLVGEDGRLVAATDETKALVEKFEKRKGTSTSTKFGKLSF